MTYSLFDRGPALTAAHLAAIAELTEDRLTAQQIAEHLHIGKRSVEEGRRILGVHGHNPIMPGQPIDEVAVLRATWGDPVELNPDERTEAVRLMNARGMTAKEIARMLNVTRRTVERHVAKVRAA